MTQEEQALMDMYYIRMIVAESAINRFIEGVLTLDSALKVISDAEKAIKQHVEMYPD